MTSNFLLNTAVKEGSGYCSNQFCIVLSRGYLAVSVTCNLRVILNFKPVSYR